MAFRRSTVPIPRCRCRCCKRALPLVECCHFLGSSSLWQGGLVMRRTGFSLALLAALGLIPLAQAADHADGSNAALRQPDASSDITDVYAWMAPSGPNMFLVMDVFPNAASSSKFSNQVKYVF